MAEIPTSEYNCSQAELYAVLRLLVTNYNTKQTDLAAFKAKYTTAYATTFSGEIDAADALPDKESREALSQTLRTELTPLNKTCLANWQTLKQYIVEVYTKEAQPANFQAAGSTYYEAAANEDWENGVQMNKNANDFITANNTKLLDGGNNMPAGFAAQYTTDSTAFKTKYDAFIAATQTTEATVAKIEANNAIFKKGMAICVDGQTKYLNNAAAAKLFTWENLLTIISPDSGGGTGTSEYSFPVLVTDSVTNAPLENAAVKVQGSTVTSLTGVDGKCFVTTDVSSVVLLITKTGYEDFSHPLTPVEQTAAEAETQLAFAIIPV